LSVKQLLVLSACESAKGDQRSILGLAGVAAQAGARSTIASLWLVDESSTATLMELFYSGLSAGLPKAEALRLAKLGLMDSPEFSHPFFWGSFILIGSWL
jgi:CHAT domain-containing protein